MEEELIEFVSQNRFLYDKASKHYKNIYLRDQKFQEHADKVNIPVQKLKARWRTLRDKFYKDLKKQPSGSGVDSPHKKWKWMDRLMFLKDVDMENMNTQGNYNDVEYEFLTEDLSFNGDFPEIASTSSSKQQSEQSTPGPKKATQKRKIASLIESANKDFHDVTSLAKSALSDNSETSGIKLFFESLGVQADKANLSAVELSGLQLQMSQSFHNFMMNREQ